MIKIDEAFIDTYINKATDDKLSKLKKKASKDICIHAEGKPDDELLRKYQPSEPDWAVEYKKDNYRAVTQALYDKILSVIAKIERAPDFIIRFDKPSAKIKSGETLEEYTSKDYPKYKSLKNWAFNSYMNEFLLHPNGVLVGEPLEEGEKQQVAKPVMCTYKEEQIIKFTDDFLLIKLYEESPYLSNGKVYKVIDDTFIYEMYEKTESYEIQEIYKHGLGYIPAIYNGGIECEHEGKKYFESMIRGVVPSWHQAIVENQDKNVSVKMHAYPESAVYASDTCQECNGSKFVTETRKRNGTDYQSQSTCKTCKGSGVAPSSPFGISIQRPMRANELAAPIWAPKKYIEKDLKPLDFLKKDVADLLVDGLKAVNMDFLAELPKEESGKSKAYDWEQTNLFLYNLASYFIQRNIIFSYEVINDYRNGVLLGKVVEGEENEMKIYDTEELNDQLPIISVPEDYDIIDADSLEEEIARAKEAGIEPNIIAEMEKKYIAKRFAGDPNTINFLTDVINLDPLRNLTEDEKLARLARNGVNQDQYIMSCQIEDFVYMASQQYKDFYTKEYLDKKTIIEGYASEWKAKNKPVALMPIAPIEKPPLEPKLKPIQ